MEKNEKQQKESFKSKLENFWYYYKVPVIAVLILVLIAFYLINKHNQAIVSDLKVSLVTADMVAEDSINFNYAMPGLIQDINGDGEANITISRLYLEEDLSSDNVTAYAQALEEQFANKGATLFIVDKLNLDRMMKKDAFCPLDELLDVAAYGDRVIDRNGVPMALHLAGSKVLADMNFTNDDLYALILFRRPGEVNDPVQNAEYQNAVLMLEALMQQADSTNPVP